MSFNFGKSIFSIATILLLISCTVCFAGPVQWEIEDGGNGHFYEAISVPEQLLWDDAKTAAELKGGYLATITSAEENEFIFTLIDDPIFLTVGGSNAQGPWLGGFQPAGSPEPAGNWQWVTGESFTYTSWAQYEPSNAGMGEDKLSFNSFTPNTRASNWNDVPSDSLQFGYVIETVPEPATVLLFGLGGLALRRKRRA